MTQGQVLALVVMNFSATLNGYSLEFGNDAEIFDDTAPFITEANANCAQDGITVVFSESLLLSEFDPSEIQVEIAGNTFPVTDIESSGNTYVTELTLVVPSMTSEVGAATIIFNEVITDVCGNPLPDSFPINLTGTMSMEVTVGPACNGEGGSITIEVENGGVSCPSLSINAVIIPSADAGCGPLVAANLAPGNYVVGIINNDDECILTQHNILVVNDDPVVSAGVDFSSCDLSTTVTANAPSGNFVWTAPQGVSFQNVNAPETTVSVNAPGTYTLTGTLTVGTCVASDEVSITFSSPPNVDIEPTGLSCFYLCDGAVSFQDNNNPSIQVNLNGVIENGNNITYSNLCEGSYSAEVTFSPGCSANYDFTISSPPVFEAAFDYSPALIAVDNPEVTLTSLEFTFDSLEFIIPVLQGERFTTNPSIVQLPAEPGFYEVELVVYLDGCEQRNTLSVRVVDNLVVFIPNSFTPDGDDLNDVFLPIFSTEPEFYSLQVFNRWGDMIFETTDWKQPWIGDVNEGEYYGVNDLYFWKMSYKGAEIDVIEREGSVILIR